MRNPYGNPAGFAQHIKDLQEAGLLDDKAVITQDAYDAYQSLIDAQDAKAATLTFMPDSDLQTVIDYLDCIDQAAAGLNTPIQQIIVAEKPCDTPAHRIYELISHLRAFRDDAHVQAWQPLGISGHTYEMFSFVWNGEAPTVEQFLEVRGTRGYDAEACEQALTLLAEKGWIEQGDDGYVVTETGKQVRDDIEVKTDTFFYQAFDGLTDEDLADFRRLLAEITEKFALETENA
ncbi:MAG: hypothetical protein AAFN11_08915 [Chloroflexota bacterium]